MNSNLLEERLIDFSISVFELCSSLKSNNLTLYLSKQLIRSSTSSALNYGESRGAESKKDFVHKLRITLKELRETHISIKILRRSHSTNRVNEIEVIQDECNQLISIFVATIKTAENRAHKNL